MPELTKTQLMTLKKAQRDQIRASGGLDPASRECRHEKSQLSNFQNNNRREHMPVDDAVALTLESGDVSILRAMAEVAGYELTPLDIGDADLLQMIDRLARRNVTATEHQNVTTAALSDGKVDIDEARRIHAASAVRLQANQEGHDLVTRLLGTLEGRQAQGEHKPSMKVVS